ncbi:MAG: SbcC/MukB-like Walker B domain-containing protein, partial [Kineosporiaceae bacterium]
RRALDIERAGLGGTTLAELERRLGEAAQTRDRRRDKAHRFDLLTAELGLPPLSGQAHHGELLRQVHASAEQGQQARAVAETERESATVAKGRLEAEAAEVNAELRSLSQRPNNIPRRSLELRERLCDELGVDPEELPFAGELIQVRDDAREWEGAAERVLHGFALSLLVPHHRYPAVSEWIDANHLGIRLVYHRVPETLAPQRVRPEGDQQQLRLVDLLEVRADSAFGSWLNRELEHRADHVCAATMAEFRRLRKAVTRAGQVRHDNRHEKNDERAVGDRRWYVLGWSSARKVDVLLEHAARLHGDLAAAAERLRQAGQALARLDARITTVRLLTTEFADYTDLDWESLVAQIARDGEAKRQIEESSRDLERVTEELAAVVAQLDRAGNERAGVDRRIGDLENSERTWAAQVAETEAVLEGATPAAPAVTTALGARLPAEPFTQPGEVDRWEAATGRAITVESDRRRERQAVAVRRALALMHAFRGSYPVETTEMDAAVEAAPAYRELAQRLRDDDLPRFEAEFKTYLNTNTIREIATFQSSLQRQVELIRERVDKINSSLVSIDYNPGRYIRLEALATPNVEIRDFRSELLACTDDVLTGGTDDDQYSEAKFAQVQRIIERFRGRVGQTEADRAWTTRVTDVRNWFLFTASERWRDDDREHESYADSAGKSGGQKEKLAYTILAASLAYQFRLDWGVTSSRTFRFVVIDEAFGRGSDESTRFALGLFRTLNLQLLIVTPLQKIHVIEPYVAAVGFVDNRTGSASRLQTLTIEEVRSRRAKRGAR